MLAVHVLAWGAALVYLPRPSIALQSICVLLLGGAALAASMLRRRRRRLTSLAMVLALFFAASIALPLPMHYGNTPFMGDGEDFAEHRAKFEANIPWAAGDAELHFKAHLGDAILARVDAAFGRTDRSPSIAYRVLSRVGGLLFLAELALVLIVTRGSRRACRFLALALAVPLSLTFFGYYEVGYLAASAAAFPLLVLAAVRRVPPMPGRLEAAPANHIRAMTHLHAAGVIQGLHAALHGFGILGIAGGAIAMLAAAGRRWRAWTASVQFSAFALALYLGWILLYVLVFKLSVTADPAASHIAFRRLATAFYFDKRLVFPLATWRGLAEVGVASLATGVPLLVFGAATSNPRTRTTRMALAFALPALLFLVFWWPSLGVNRDLDLLLGAFGAVMAGAWLASRRTSTTAMALGVLAVVHVCFWSVILDRSLDRIWLGEVVPAWRR